MITPVFKNGGYKSIHEYLKGWLEIRLGGQTLEYMEEREAAAVKKGRGKAAIT